MKSYSYTAHKACFLDQQTGSFEMKQWRASVRKTSRQDNPKAEQTLQVSPAPYVRDKIRNQNYR